MCHFDRIEKVQEREKHKLKENKNRCDERVWDVRQTQISTLVHMCSCFTWNFNWNVQNIMKKFLSLHAES